MGPDPIRLEQLRPDQVERRWAVAPIAYVPIGCIEYHGPHLPLGVDGLTAHTVCEQAAAIGGGVVHPVSYMANGCLDLPYTLTFPANVVELWARAIVDQLHMRGARLVVLLTGHGPLDLIHLLKRVAATYQDPDSRAYGLCYLELNAARLTEPEYGEPTVIDHASTIETSWILAGHPELVDLDRLPHEEDAKTVGIYGKNPRFTATADLGSMQQAACAELLAERCSQMLDGRWADDNNDLRKFVDFSWPEKLELKVNQGDPASRSVKSLTIGIHNPGRASRYVTRLHRVVIDGRDLDIGNLTLTNSSVGEVGEPVCVANLDKEHGIYVRRSQTLDLRMRSGEAFAPLNEIRIELELAGVRSQLLSWSSTDDYESAEVLDGEADGTYIRTKAGKDSNL